MSFLFRKLYRFAQLSISD